MNSLKHKRGLNIAIIVVSVVAVLAILWRVTTPPAHYVIHPPYEMGPTPQEILKVQAAGDPLSEKLLVEITELPGSDDIILQEEHGRAFVTGMDGWIWKVDLKKKTAERSFDAPLMASGARQVPGDADKIVFCASHLFGETYPKNEQVGIYELTISTKTLRPLLTRVPIVPKAYKKPAGNDGMVYAPQGSPFRLSIDKMNNANSMPAMFCNDLDISRDGKRIYFSEPFAYEGASMGGGAVGEAIALGRNGKLWCLNFADRTIDLVAEGYSFVDGVLLEHEKDNRDDKENSVLITETIKFRIMRLYLTGKRAGQDEVVWKDLPGMPDGLDRDTKGRIWIGLLKKRSGLVNFIHKHPWIKPLFLRLPESWVPAGKSTGIMALSSDASQVLYFTPHDGKAINDISVVVPGKERIYLPRFDRRSHGLYSMKNPLD